MPPMPIALSALAVYATLLESEYPASMYVTACGSEPSLWTSNRKAPSHAASPPFRAMHDELPSPSVSSRNTTGRRPTASATSPTRRRNVGPYALIWPEVGQPPSDGCRKYVLRIGIDLGSAL